MIFARYVLIQLIAYAIDLGAFVLIVNTGLSGPILANISSKLAAGAFAFVCHRNFTFSANRHGDRWNQAVRYLILLGLNIPLTTILLGLAMMWIDNVTVAKIFADVAGVAITFCISKAFVFVGPRSKPLDVKGDD